MLRHSARCFARAEAALAAAQHRAAVTAAADGLSALPTTTPTLHLALLNAHGIALHHLGDLDGAHQSLTHALDVAQHIARRGASDDNYLGIGGCLIDLAANHLRRGEVDAADRALKRGKYMLARAYRPTQAATACLMVLRGMVHEARDEHKAALDAQQSACELLLKHGHSGMAESAAPHAVSWLQAARSGSIWGLIALGKPRAAETLATADLQRIDADNSSMREQREFARSIAAIAALERLQHSTESSATATRTAQGRCVEILHEVAHALAILCGEQAHPEVVRAQANAEMAALHAAQSDSMGQGPMGTLDLQWQRHWQPSLGCGLHVPPRSASGWPNLPHQQAVPR